LSKTILNAEDAEVFAKDAEKKLSSEFLCESLGVLCAKESVLVRAHVPSFDTNSSSVGKRYHKFRVPQGRLKLKGHKTFSRPYGTTHFLFK
jgi:hypothetical protein